MNFGHCDASRQLIHHWEIEQSTISARPAARAKAKGMVSQANSRRTAGQTEDCFSISIIRDPLECMVQM